VSRLRRASLALLLGCAAAAFGVGVTHAALDGRTANPGNVVSAAADFQAPAIANLAVIATDGTANALQSGADYRVYANVTDGGNPASGVASVTANVATLTAGQTAVALAAGSFTVNGVTYNRRSALLTADTLPSGPRAFSAMATDNAANTATANATATVDNAFPSATNIQTISGGQTGRPSAGDSVVYTFSEPVQAATILAGWSGAATNIDVRIRNGGNPTGDRLEVWSGGTSVALGTVNLARSDYMSGGNAWFYNSTMTMSGSTVTIVLSSPTGTANTAGGPATMSWVPSTAVRDLAGNALAATQATESGPLDLDF
jgi:hypothetical protein